MIRLLKSLLPREPLPPHVHFHLNEAGNEVWCDESACRPKHGSAAPYFPFVR